MALLDFTGSPHGGSHKLLPEWNSQPRITPTAIIDHSIVGSALGAWWFFHDSTGIESTFIIRLDGHIWQLMDTGRESDANLDFNDHALSIEHEDNGDPDNFPFSDRQLASNIWLKNKLVAVHPTIPRKKVTGCNGDASKGLGYHSLLGAPSCLTPARGKTCPGKPVRVEQWNRIILPAFLNPEETEDMTPEQAKQLADVATKVDRIEGVLFAGHERQNVPIDNLYKHANLIHDALVVPGTTSAEQAFDMLFARVRTIENTTQETVATVEAMSAKLDTLVAELGPPPAP
jgi:N-acetyl-anhydromuramyl-L-alanine amidase AmpD